jgi:hypothetical protein
MSAKAQLKPTTTPDALADNRVVDFANNEETSRRVDAAKSSSTATRPPASGLATTICRSNVRVLLWTPANTLDHDAYVILATLLRMGQILFHLFSAQRLGLHIRLACVYVSMIRTIS